MHEIDPALTWRHLPEDGDDTYVSGYAPGEGGVAHGHHFSGTDGSDWSRGDFVAESPDFTSVVMQVIPTRPRERFVRYVRVPGVGVLRLGGRARVRYALDMYRSRCAALGREPAPWALRVEELISA